MSTSKPKVKKISASELRELEARRFVGRSDVYRYMRKNYTRLVGQKVGSGEGPSWDDIAAILTKRGYVSSRRQRLTANAVRRVFRRVEQDLNRTEQSTLSPAPPSRQRPDWQPPLAVSQRMPEPRTPPQRQPPTETLPRAGPVREAGTAKAKLAAFQRRLLWIDRHIIQQPDED